MTRDSLVKGTLILTAAALVARVLGAVQKIPLVALLGDAGMGTYTIAFNIYSILLVVATAGVPSALSRLTAERTALGQYAEANRIYRSAVQFALVSGAVVTALLFVAAPYYAVYVARDPTSTLAIRAIAPALLLFPLIAVMRGYFQGRQHMLPNGLSQVVEQVVRLAAAVGLAYGLLKLGFGGEWAVAGASFGGVMGSVGAIAVMLYFIWKLRRADRKEGKSNDADAGGANAARRSAAPAKRPSQRGIYATIFRISVPIVIFSMTVPLIYAIDSSIVIPLLESRVGSARALEILGVLGGRAQSLAGIPIIFAVALSQSVVPVISAAHARGDAEQLRMQAARALRMSILSGLPMVLAICAAARTINIFLFGNDEGTWIIIALTISAIFQIVMQTSGAVLMGLGEMKKLVVCVAAGIAIKLAGSFLLAPGLGIYGIIAATALCFLVMSQMNIYVLRRNVTFAILGRKWPGLIAAAAVSVLAGAGCEYALSEWAQAPFLGPRLNAGLDAAISGGLAFVLYGVLLPAARVITSEDMRGLPAPVRKAIGRLAGRAGQTAARESRRGE